MTHTAPLLLAVILASSSLLARTRAGEASLSCASITVLDTNDVIYTFLRRDPLRLYSSSWTGRRALLGCAWSDDAQLIQQYSSLCRERAHEFSDHPIEEFDVDSMFESEDLCVSAGDTWGRERTGRRFTAGGSEVGRVQRVKRGFIVPGTLWCGSGNKAPSYEDLGVFSDTDSCCREHDQCKHTILSFHSQFGVFNSNIFTMSHCDCDRKFHSCLTEASDSISDVVGYTFFNLLKMHCFEFSHQLQCTQRNWFGMCKETKLALYAEVHPPTMYDSPSPTEVSVNTSHPAAASTVPPPSISTASTVTNTTQGPAGPEPGPGPERTDELENTLSTREQDAAESQLSCSVYKDLDECKSKILPQQTRYGIQNQESTTLYHCNCTTRLFQTLAKQKQLTDVQTRLLGLVSPSCFLPQNCTAGGRCTAVVVKAELPQVEQRSGAEVEERRHLQAVRLKVRRPNSRRAKRKDGAARLLHRLCLRMVNRSRKQAARRPAARQRELE